MTGGSNGGSMFAPLPRCPVHGQMTHRMETEPAIEGVRIITRSWWACHGWDGEDCEHTVDDADLDWTPAGPLDCITWT
jgi:hypothetical protein